MSLQPFLQLTTPPGCKRRIISWKSYTLAAIGFLAAAAS